MEAEILLLKEAIKQGLFGPDEARGYLRAYESTRSRGQAIPIGDWLMGRGLISPQQLAGLEQLADQERRPRTMVLGAEESPAQPKPLLLASSEAEPRDPDPAPKRGRKVSPLDRLRDRAGSWRGTRFGPYLIESEIARGGMGAVYKVRHPERAGFFALKVLLARSQSSKRTRQRFLREIDTIRRLDHPGIVSIVDHGTIDGVDYLAMDFIDGVPFDQMLRKRNLPWRQAAIIVGALAEALDHAHSMGVIHRDLKPANVIIRKGSGIPVLTDFGLAKDLLDSAMLSGAGTVIGTPRYLSPEQVKAEHENIGPATDVYALGVMLYEGLTRRQPFDADSVETLYRKIEEEQPDDPRAVNPEIPRELAEVCLKCLCKDRRHRYATAAELSRDLATYFREGTVEVRRLDLEEAAARARFEGGRTLRRLALAGVLVLALAALVSGGLYYYRGLFFARPFGPEDPGRSGGRGSAGGEDMAQARSRALALRGEARAFESEGKFDQALLKINEAVQLLPEMGVLHLQRGGYLFKQSEFVSAIAALDKAAGARTPAESPLLYRLRGLSRFEVGTIRGAYADLAEFHRRGTGDAETFFKAAVCLRRLGRPREAIEELKRAGPRSAPALAERVRCRLALGQYSFAVAEQRVLLKLAPRDPSYLLLQARALAGSGQLAEAEAEVEALLELAGAPRGEVLSWLTWFQILRGDARSALRNAEAAGASGGDAVDVTALKARALCGLDRRLEARSALAGLDERRAGVLLARAAAAASPEEAATARRAAAAVALRAPERQSELDRAALRQGR